MNYKIAEVKGHQRAGNHYLCWLLNENFFKLPNFYGLSNNGSHLFGHQHKIFQSDVLYIYIYADLLTTAKSLLKIGNRFSIGTNNLDDLLSDKKMGTYATKVPPKNVRLDKFTQAAFDKVGDYANRRSEFAFKFKDMSLAEWHEKHIKSWFDIDKPNLIYVKYEDLIDNFDATMLYIAKKLGSNKKEFINTNKQVGVIHKDEDIL